MSKKIIAVLVIVTAFVAFQVHAGSYKDWKEERDHISMLAAYTLVYNNWQTKDEGSRGYNIGCVVLHGKQSKSRLVYTGLNSIQKYHDNTQHSEVRCIQGYINDYVKQVGKKPSFKNTTIYTTLEPCAQCSGMIVMNYFSRVVYGMKDKRYGQTIEKLKAAPPYPNTEDMTSQQIKRDKITKQLEEWYETWKNEQKQAYPPLTDFLYDDKTKKIMGDACQEFVDYKVEFEDENKEFYIDATKLVQTKDQLESQIQDVLEQPDDMQDEFEADKRTDY